jgi:hypothetical protein
MDAFFGYEFFTAVMPVIVGMIVCEIVRAAGAVLMIMTVVMSMVFAVIVTAIRTVFVPVI